VEPEAEVCALAGASPLLLHPGVDRDDDFRREVDVSEQELRVLEHLPGAWFLLQSADRLLLDVACDRNAIGYSVVVELDAAERERYASRGRDYVAELAAAIRDSDPGGRGGSSLYLDRDLTPRDGPAVATAIAAWRRDRDGGAGEGKVELNAPARQAELASIMPFFIVRDVLPATEFYREKLGFEPSFVGPEGDPYFAIVRRDQVSIMLKAILPEVPPLPNPARHPWARWDAYVHTPDPDALAAELAARGVTFHESLGVNADQQRGFEIQDLNGYVLYFGRPVQG
jgi:hypothetical protein